VSGSEAPGQRSPSSSVSVPWLTDSMAALKAAQAAGRMPHALLIQAAEGSGGSLLANWCAQLVLCTSAAPPCGQCQGCRRAAEERHPDLLLVRPLEDSQQIRIEQVRELGAELALSSHQGGYKVAIIEPADTLNRFAANSLLKTLEEPPPRTLLVLVAAQPSRLPATLTSRCQRVRVRAPARAQSLDWLQSVRGSGDWDAVLDVIGEAPFAAATLDPTAVRNLRTDVVRTVEEIRGGLADPVTAAERWSRSELPLRLACLENWLTECIRQSLAGSAGAAEVRAGAHQRGADFVMNTPALFGLLDRVRELKAALPTPINRSLALESLLRSVRT